jgi:hypothetical protein
MTWYDQGYCARLGAHVVYFADDLAIRCRPGIGGVALTTMRQLMGRFYGKGGRSLTQSYRRPSRARLRTRSGS